MAHEFEEFQDTFLEESAEGLDLAESTLLQLDPGAPDDEAVNAIFRAIHSIKGGAGAVGFESVAEFAHVLETVLDQVRDGRRAVTQELIDLLLRAVDCARSLIEEQKDGTTAQSGRVEEVRCELQALREPDPEAGSSKATTPADESTPSVWRIQFRPHPDFLQKGVDPTRIFGALEEMGRLSVRVDRTELPSFDELDPETCYLGWELQLEGRVGRAQLDEIFGWVQEDCDLELSPIATEAPSPGPSTPARASTEHGFGEIAVELGFISEAQRDEVLAAQAKDPLRRNFGILAGARRWMTIQQIEEVAEEQARRRAAMRPVAAPVPDPDAPPKPSKPARAEGPPRDAPSIRVTTGKVDALVNMVGELVITQSILSDLDRHFDMSRREALRNGLAQLQRNTREIQDTVLQIRMLPIGMVFKRFPRMVRDTARALGKKVELCVSGEQTAVDRTILEKIGDPLVHLIRNSLDHGIETPEDRVAAGKPEGGTIHLLASHQEGKIVIDLVDDGKGIDTDRVLAKARERGLVHPDVTPPRDQLVNYIFHPGFSTAQQVTDLSGRGVGMDVVWKNISDLGGHLEVRSEAGAGTRFMIRLPLTLAILDGQLLRIGNQTFVLPLASILETVQIQRERVNVIVGEAETYRVRDEWVPIIRLHDVLGIPEAPVCLDGGLLVLVEVEGRKAGLLVDELLEHQQVVIKSLDENFRRVRCVSGATILGDGTVALILDSPGVFDAVYGDRAPTIRTAA
jgi:two-component system chemotaxis sensor kinase CheA